MSAKSSIEWTDSTWTPIRAQVKHNAAEIARAKGYTSLVQIAGKMAGHIGPHCEHLSPGCERCYSETNNGRCLPANGTGLPFDRRARDLVEIILDEDVLMQPLHWKKPRKIFVCSQTDLFGEWVPDEMIDRVFAVMALSPQHTFQVLTKRAQRMHDYFASARKPAAEQRGWNCAEWLQSIGYEFEEVERCGIPTMHTRPLAHIYLGVSVEDQSRADERITWLLRTPAAVRFVSYEPALGRVDFTALPIDGQPCSDDQRGLNALTGEWSHYDEDSGDPCSHWEARLDQIIFGGESGPDARPCEIQWARDTRDQCKEAGVAFFMKQVGSRPFDAPRYRQQIAWPDKIDWRSACEPIMVDRKGGNPSEWPKDLRIREFPQRGII